MTFKKLLLATGILCACLPIHAQTKDPAEKEGSMGTVTFTYSGKKVTYKTVRAKDGNIWLQQNLGSQSPATDPKDRLSFGDLFQWGRWDDGHQVREPINSSHMHTTPNNPAGLSLTGKNPFLYDGILYPWWSQGTDVDKWSAETPGQATETNGCDPCKALGAGWHLPSIDDWENVIKLEGITDGSSSIASNLRLSLAGEREWNGISIRDAGKGGVYWSNTAANRDGGARVFMMNAESVGTQGAYYRGSGASVRCMKTSGK